MHCFSAMNTVRFSGLWLTESFLDNRPPLSLRSTGYFRNDEHASRRARSRSHCRGHFHFHELALDGRHLSSVPKRNAQHLATGRSAQLYRSELASPPRRDRHRLLIHTHRALQRRNFRCWSSRQRALRHRDLGRDVAADHS